MISYDEFSAKPLWKRRLWLCVLAPCLPLCLAVLVLWEAAKEFFANLGELWSDVVKMWRGEEL